MSYLVYVNQILYLATRDAAAAFKMFRAHTGQGNNVNMEFVTDPKVSWA
jgi:hypothetical protein